MRGAVAGLLGGAALLLGPLTGCSEAELFPAPATPAPPPTPVQVSHDGPVLDQTP